MRFLSVVGLSACLVGITIAAPASAQEASEPTAAAPAGDTAAPADAAAVSAEAEAKAEAAAKAEAEAKAEAAAKAEAEAKAKAEAEAKAKAEEAKARAAAEAAAKAQAAEDAKQGVQRSASGYVMSAPELQVRRGWYAELEVGPMVTFGGYKTNQVAAEDVSEATVSNAQPYVSVNLGYDVYSGESVTLSIGPSFGFGANAGAGRPSDEDLVTDKVLTVGSDYSVYQGGLTLGLAWMVGERWSLVGKLGGGGALVDPDPTLNAEAPKAGDPVFMGTVNASLGAELYTLLTGFSVGVSLRFVGLLGDEFIPALALPVSVKYTF